MIALCKRRIKGNLRKGDSLVALINHVMEYRKKAGYKRKELAKAVGSCEKTIYNLETGAASPSLEVAVRISKELHVPMDQLYDWE